MGDNREAQIRRRAYEIWEQEGRPHGKDLSHWIKALEEIERTTEKAEKQASKSGGRAKSARASGATRPAATASKQRPDTANNAKEPRKTPMKRGKGNGQNAPS
jgi:hypothetical protein